MDKLEMTVEQFKATLETAKAEAKAAKDAVEAMQNKLDTSETEQKVAADKLKTASEAIEKLNKDFEAYKLEDKGGDTPSQTLAQAIEIALKADDFKVGKTIEVKASTADIATPITNSQLIPGVNMPRERALAFMPEFTVRAVQQDKDAIVYVEGQYASNVGYTTEGNAAGTDDIVSAAEKSRGLAKIAAKIKVTAEMYEDKSYIAQMLQTEMRNKAMQWLDEELFKGEGTDADGKKDKIYGLKTHATAFNATKAGVAISVDTPTTTDLAEAIKLQGVVVDAADSAKAKQGGFSIDLLYINPVDAVKWRNSKDKNNQYLLTRLSDGSQIMGGLRVVETKAIPANSMLGIESGLAELWIKRNFELKVGQEGNDFSKDMYTIVLFMRGQSLVKTLDLPGVIYVSDITAALAAITKPTV